MSTATDETPDVESYSLGDFFSRSVSECPNRPALFASGKLWSYSQLDGECRAIEQTLGAVGTVTEGARHVGLIYGRGAFSYASIIAIMRSRHVYVPLNPKMPAAKLARILEDAAIRTVIIDGSEPLSEGVMGLLRRTESLQVIIRGDGVDASLEALLEATSHQVRRISEARAPSTGAAAVPREAPGGIGNLAYIIYTSGSTGAPKGVPITHESACRCIEKAHRLFGTHSEDRFTEFSALSFDVSILDLFLCWKSGGALYVAEASEALVPHAFVSKHQITVWSSVPSLANFLLKLRLLKRNALPHVRLFLFCGEALPVELARACSGAAPRSRVFNLYGPTECTIFATCHEYIEHTDRHRGTVPIGVPLPGLRCKIVDEDRVIEAQGEVGELWLSGDQLTAGYWNNPLATRAAFVTAVLDDPSTQVWYRTGDLVSWQSPAGLSFHGRIDRQVKLRGYRIELQEVESILRDVIGCALVAIIPIRNEGGIVEKIVAYCDDLSADEATIKARCSSRMPTYMVPDRILRLDTFPLSDNGKVNYLALSAEAY